MHQQRHNSANFLSKAVVSVHYKGLDSIVKGVNRKANSTVSQSAVSPAYLKNARIGRHQRTDHNLGFYGT